MKLAEALAERSDCQKRLEELKKRMLKSARIQEGDQPAEDLEALLSESEQVFSRLLELIGSINRTNARTPFNAKQSISDAIAERDVTGKRRDFLSSIADAASTRQDRYSKTEVRFVATISIAKLNKEVDQLSKHLRELDTRIQELNWRTDLV